MTSIKKYQIIGTTDDVDTCDCCGRINLKKTVILKDAESGEEVYFGTECAAKALNWAIQEVTKTAKSETENIKRQIEFQIRVHPLMIQMDREINEMNKKQIPFSERLASGCFKRYNEWKTIARQEVEARFPKVS